MDENYKKYMCNVHEGIIVEDECCIKYDNCNDVCLNHLPKSPKFIEDYYKFTYNKSKLILYLYFVSIIIMTIIFIFTNNWDLINYMFLSSFIFIILYSDSKNFKIIYLILVTLILHTIVKYTYSFIYYNHFDPPWDLFIDVISHISFGIIWYVIIRVIFPTKSPFFILFISFVGGVVYEIIEFYFFVYWYGIENLEWNINNMFLDLVNNTIGNFISGFIDIFLVKKNKQFI